MTRAIHQPAKPLAVCPVRLPTAANDLSSSAIDLPLVSRLALLAQLEWRCWSIELAASGQLGGYM